MGERGLWVWHVAAGGVVLVLLGLHMGVMHLDAILGVFNPAGGHPIDWENVVARGEGWFFPATYVVLLGAALFHGLFGLRNILHELGPGPGLGRALDGVLLLVGIGLFVLGSWAAVAARGVALGAGVSG